MVGGRQTFTLTLTNERRGASVLRIVPHVGGKRAPGCDRVAMAETERLKVERATIIT